MHPGLQLTKVSHDQYLRVWQRHAILCCDDEEDDDGGVFEGLL